MFPAADIVDDLRLLLRGKPVFLAGSLVAAETYGLPYAFSDADIFTPSTGSLMATTQYLLCHGYQIDERFERVWHRWQQYGTRGWHTNSIRLFSSDGVEVNVIHKLIQKNPTTSLSQVLESFDFGLLGVGYDLEDNTRRDLRPYLFPGMDLTGPLPLLPNKRTAWRAGFISQYNGLRQAGRYAKYHGYGYDMSLVKDDLIVGYRNAGAYLTARDKEEKKQLGMIYWSIADYIDEDRISELAEASKEILYLDSLDQIMDSLE